jgi:crooked neck
MSRAQQGQVKNRAPAPIQISAEQLLREAADRQEQHVLEPIVKIHDAEEYQSYLRDRRKHFEDNIRYRREHIGNWVKYARFEEENKELERARSVFERSLEVDHRSAQLWLRYAEFEMRNEFVNHSRNVLDRAVQILPRVDFLWYKYVYMEEMVGDILKTRAVFERWMEWMPDDNAWLAFSRFETRHRRLEAAHDVMTRYVNAYPSSKAFLKYAKWAEYEAKDIPKTRLIYESSLSELEPEEINARIFKQFAGFEERHGEYDRARVIYKHALQLFNLGLNERDPTKRHAQRTDIIEKDEDVDQEELDRRDQLYKSYVSFEKKHGDRRGIEIVLLTKQRAEYAKRVEDDPLDYDAWLEYAKLEEDHIHIGNSIDDNDNPQADGIARTREVYERAVANIPPASEQKQFWKRYIYLWINFAVFEEMTVKDIDRSADVYNTCLSLIPHQIFSFSKIWIYAAKCHVRRKDLATARKLFGKAIGLCGKQKIFIEYIDLELALGEIDRCRALYNNYLKAMPHNCTAWAQYAELEKSVGESERCRAIYQLAIKQPTLDMPEMLWKAYIDFEIDEGEADRARALYEDLLERTGHVKVWISFAQFEGSPLAKGLKGARDIFERANAQLKEERLKEERVLLLDAWRVFEKQKGDSAGVSEVEAKLPRRIKRRRMRTDESGNELGWEEFFDYHFPEEEGAETNNLKILEMAAKWKQSQHAATASDSDDDSDMESDDES